MVQMIAIIKTPLCLSQHFLHEVSVTNWVSQVEHGKMMCLEQYHPAGHIGSKPRSLEYSADWATLSGALLEKKALIGG